MSLHLQTEESKNEIELMNKMIETLKETKKNHEEYIQLKEGEILEKDTKIRSLEDEVSELKGVLYKLSDVRNVLNRVLEPYSSNPDKMIVQMKEGEDLTNQINRVTLETTKRNPPSENLQEDFWYAEKNDYDLKVTEQGGAAGGFLDNPPNFFLNQNQREGYVPKITKSKNDQLRKSKGNFRLRSSNGRNKDIF